MPVVFAELGTILVSYLGVDAEVAYAIETILEYAAVLELLNAAQKALAPSLKSGVGPGLEVVDV